MDFLSALIAYAGIHGVSADDTRIMHENYCQNLYWQPNALEKMQQAHCDIEAVSREVSRVQSGRYE